MRFIRTPAYVEATSMEETHICTHHMCLICQDTVPGLNFVVNILTLGKFNLHRHLPQYMKDGYCKCKCQLIGYENEEGKFVVVEREGAPKIEPLTNEEFESFCMELHEEDPVLADKVWRASK